ncbi:unnamed protein product [Phytophthora fragariaefolia]|uniref:Transmembrane protein 198 n=1 Tax=Phytophthora fragariaefolia TaxID=1490495 RepID=A0A9W6Y1X9_9STRA|nr:unnamed protein product [Phytophthora fragariaefolia]
MSISLAIPLSPSESHVSLADILCREGNTFIFSNWQAQVTNSSQFAMQKMQSPFSRVLFALIACQLLPQVSYATNENVAASDSMESLFDSVKGVHLGGSILAMAAIAVGIVTVILGYRIFRVTLFMVRFAFGGTGVALGMERALAAEVWVVTASWVGFIVGGTLCGFLVLCLTTLGIVAVGVAAGIVLAMVLDDAFGYMLFPSSPGMCLALLCLVFGLLGGVLAFKLEKPVLIIATSLFGAGVLVWGVGYFAGDVSTLSDLKQIATQDANGDWQYSVPSAWCAYLTGFVVAFAAGLCIQFRMTSRRGQYHKPHAGRHRTRNAPYILA